MENILNYIDGKLIAPQSGAFFDNINPATGKVLCLIPNSQKEDVDLAVEAATNAFPYWSNLSIEERGDWLMKLADGISRRMDEFVEAESKDNGKPIKLARQVDIPRAISNFKFFATGIQHYASQSHEMVGVGINYTLRKPIGIVGCISPWNLPLYLFTWKIAPALAAGNCVIAKPSEITPLTATLFGELCNEAGLPPGVLNIVHGRGNEIGTALVEHPAVSAISFTGGTKIGADIASRAAPKFKKLSLELGGKNPTLVFADCEWRKTIEQTVRGAFLNQGEICLCGSRILVEESVYERFVADFVAEARKLLPADPALEETRHGALVSREHMEKVLGYIELAKQEGGQIECGGERVVVEGRCREGRFVAPTVITGLSMDCRTNQEEIF